MKHSTFIAATAAAVLSASGASAVPVDISVIDAEWANASGGLLGSTIDNANPNAVQVRWPADGQGTANPSSYTFERAGITDSSNPDEEITPFTVGPDSPFSLGTFTHRNFAIPSGSGISSVDLDLTFGGYPTGFPGFEVTFDTTFFFLHNETPNAGPCPVGSPPCADIVRVEAEGGPDQVVRVGKVQYTFTLLGFSVDGSAPFNPDFVSAENGSNSVDLWAKYTVSIIPLPAAGWLLLGGLGALGAVARRRRKAA